MSDLSAERRGLFLNEDFAIIALLLVRRGDQDEHPERCQAWFPDGHAERCAR
jgi:prepilin-type processing-associated H-X9-DG protein